MIKAEAIGNGVSISIDGDGETMQREFLGIVTTITETLIEEENMSPEEVTDVIKKHCRAGTCYAIHRLKQKTK